MQVLWLSHSGGVGMRRSLFFILVSGVVIVGGAITSAIVEVDCPQCTAGVVDCAACLALVRCPECGGARGLECLKCDGLGIIVKSTGAFINDLEVECGCRGENPECPICGGEGWYPSYTIGLCEACQGEGGKSCPHCGGDGKIQLREKAIRFLKR